jgi:endonuclease I
MKHQHRLFVLGIISALSFGIFSLFALEGTRTKTLKAANYTGTYYSSINWDQTGATLKTALSTLINPHTDVGYSGLWNVYKTSDVDANGKIWDVYSNYRFTIGTGQCGTYKVEGDCYNREHTIPQSIFSEAAPMVSDAHHIYPTDGKVNGMRSNFPHGKVASATYTSGNGSKLGSSDTSTGYSGTVFEPVDEYKGDFARTYFYFVTCYQSKIPSYSYDSFSADTYPSLATWAKNLYLQWAASDPVSQKEIDRNEAIYQIQKNRNPFIDFPAAANAIWGDLTPVSQTSSEPSISSATTSTATSAPASSTPTSSPAESTPVSSTPATTSSAPSSPTSNVFNLIKSTSELVEGKRYLIGASANFGDCM